LVKNEATLAVSIMSVFIVIVSLSSIYVYSSIYSGNACNCTIPLYFLTSLLPSIGLIVGAIVAYLLGLRLKETKSKSKSMTRAIFKLFNKDERKVINELIKNENVTQASLSSTTDLNRVKIYRLILELERKNILKKEEKGKTYTLSLTDDFNFLKDIK